MSNNETVEIEVSVLLLDQPVTLKLVLGGSLMIGAVIIVEMLNNKKAKTQ